MYLREFQIDKIKCFESTHLKFPHNDEDYSGWIVILGGNGSGKSTLLQAIALTLVGPLAGQRLLNPQGWIRPETTQGYGTIQAEIVRTEQDSQLGQPRKKPYSVNFAVTGTETVEIEGQPYDQPQLVQQASSAERKALQSGPYGTKRAGWFCCGYGPFRRLTGGDSSQMELMYSGGPEARFATLFREAAALTRCQDWFTRLYSRSIDPHNSNLERDRTVFEIIKALINQLLQSQGVEIEKVDTSMIYFKNALGATVALQDLSDGFRSFLALVIDILRHMIDSEIDVIKHFNDNQYILEVEGVILIDEVDAHLHPRWQRSIGFHLCQMFPKIQFIVTTHSPFIAQAASEGGLIVLKSTESKSVDAVYPLSSIKGWTIDEIYSSPLFGILVTRDFETEHLISEHATLVAKREWKSLTTTEKRTLEEIESQLSELITPHTNPQEKEHRDKMNAYIQNTMKSIEGKK